MTAADAAVRRIERLMALHTLSLWSIVGAVLLMIAAATELRGRASDVAGTAGVCLILVALLMFLGVLITIGERIKHTWVGWFAESLLFGPVGILIAYFSARGAAREAIRAIRSAPAPVNPPARTQAALVRLATEDYEHWRDR